MSDVTLPDGLYGEKRQCPLCQVEFKHIRVRKAAIRVIDTEDDLRMLYEGLNPDHYAVIVCPRCWYAAFPVDFDVLLPWQQTNLAALPNVRKAMADSYQDVDFRQPRSLRAVQLSLALALYWYGQRKAPAHRLGEIWLRMAWIAREAGSKEKELTYLERARQTFIQAYEANSLDGSKAEVKEIYLIFELSLQLGKLNEAKVWSHILSYHKNMTNRHYLRPLFMERLDALQALLAEDERLLNMTAPPSATPPPEPPPLAEALMPPQTTLPDSVDSAGSLPGYPDGRN